MGAAEFDSATTLVRALAHFLHGRDFPNLGMTWVKDWMAAAANALPGDLWRTVYSISGWFEGIPADATGEVRAEDLAQQITRPYPDRRYPAVLLGSSNGAAMHLAAALGAPWLPQTVLQLVRRRGHDPDDPRADLDWGREPGARLLAANPELALHHMHDPNQDRLMIRQLGYFRLKRRRLGATYRRFLEERLEPGAPIILVECGQRWPTLRVGDRHVFQFGAIGGIDPEEYLHGSPRVAELLRREGTGRTAWDAPAPDGDSPEAEWGFDPALRDEVERFGSERGHPIRRLVFDHPHDLSPTVADLHRWWYEQRGIDPQRLLAESFFLIEPWWTLQAGAVPFWTVFSVESAADALADYLSERAFADVRATLFSHGVWSAGIAGPDRWREAMAAAERSVGFLGVDTERFPRDFAVYVRYQDDLRQAFPARFPMPDPLTVDDLDRFLGDRGGGDLRWVASDATGSVRADAQGTSSVRPDAHR